MGQGLGQCIGREKPGKQILSCWEGVQCTLQKPAEGTRALPAAIPLTWGFQVNWSTYTP